LLTKWVQILKHKLMNQDLTCAGTTSNHGEI
jgi:hypothetical protein